MSEHDFSVAGTAIEPRELTIPRARAVARFASMTANPNIRLLGCYGPRDDGTEAVALTISATVPQRPVNDIRKTEPLLVVFCRDDRWYPWVESLRRDFPSAPHTNLTGLEEPRSLCLYSEPWEDVRTTLTAPKLIGRIMWWLEGTASGTLHGEDQPLEPLLFDPMRDLIVPSDLLSGSCIGEPELLTCYTTGWSLKLVRSPIPFETDVGKPQVGGCLALVVTCQPQQHGVIQATPRTLRDLHDFLLPAGVDLLGLLRERLDDWIDRNEEPHDIEGMSLVLLARLPKIRAIGGEVESEELRAFAVKGSIGTLAKEVATLLENGHTGDVGANVEVLPLNPRPGLSRTQSALVNGKSRASSVDVICVGVGALGSQVVVNSVRGGFGQWTLVDHDLLQPHNLGRHALGGWALGAPKSLGLADMLNSIVDGPPIAMGFVHNVFNDLDPTDRMGVNWKSASVILDVSASVAVARYLCSDIRSPARRISLFLNPSGTALTLLAEDRSRSAHIDVLEMQHYRALISEPNLRGLLSPPSTVRSGVGCRDVSARISQDLVGLFAGIGSRAIRRAVETDQAQIVTWTVDESTYSVTSTVTEVPDVRTRKKNGWRIFWDALLEIKLRESRNAKLPNETGGVLIGSFDMARRTIYVIDATEAPPDSQGSPHGFLRGSVGLQHRVERIQEKTSGMLGYIGEWHSHPSGRIDPSAQDQKVVRWVHETLDGEGQVGVVGIVGSRNRFNLIPAGTALHQ